MCLLLETGPLLGATWFLQVLFYTIILYDTVGRVIKRIFAGKSETAITIIAIASLMAGLSTHLPFRGSVILNTVFFLYLGQLIKAHKRWENWRFPVFFLLFGACAGVAIIKRDHRKMCVG